jgi:tetratricopeptide (TPR) repeat protein
VLGAEHPDTLVTVDNLAYLYASQGRYGEAEPLCQRALAARERVAGAEELGTLGSVNNLAYLYQRQGRYGEAEPLYQRATLGAERVLGANHPSAKMFRSNWERLRANRRLPHGRRLWAKLFSSLARVRRR